MRRRDDGSRCFVDCSHRIYDKTMVPIQMKEFQVVVLADKDGAARQSRTAADFGLRVENQFICVSHQFKPEIYRRHVSIRHCRTIPLPFWNIASESMQNSGNERSATRHEAKEAATENKVAAARREVRNETDDDDKAKETATQLAREIETLMSIANAVELPMTMRHAS